MHKLNSRKYSKSGWHDCHLECFMLDFSLLPLLAFQICLWQRTLKLQYFGSSCFWAFHCFSMDSKELSSILDCFGDQFTNKNTKTYTKWLEMIAKVLNMLIGLKGNNYYSKVFKRVNYKLSNSTFWVVINHIYMISHVYLVLFRVNTWSDWSWQFSIVFSIDCTFNKGHVVVLSSFHHRLHPCPIDHNSSTLFLV